MNIVERAKRLCLSPDTEWPVIAGESAPLAALMTGYVLPLAALSAIGSFDRQPSMARTGPHASSVRACWSTGLVMALVGVVVLSVVIDALAPTFGAQKNSVQRGERRRILADARPGWQAVFQFMPVVGSLIALLGALYALYLLYLGLMRVMKSPPDKAVGLHRRCPRCRDRHRLRRQRRRGRIGPGGWPDAVPTRWASQALRPAAPAARSWR